ncbi:MAG: NAD+ synthase [Leptolyngbyaceae cyanobacterium bins.302]|nr:NAD+ synthase [Leptolyngbyaceae cyanobacterium bins.302]
MKIAIAQLNPTIGDIAGNAERILAAAQRAVQEGAQVLLTPELSLSGYPPRDLLMHPDFIDSMQQGLAQLAAELPSQLIALVGVVTLNPNAGIEGGKPLFNSVALVSGGQIQHLFHKRLLPTYDVFDEDRYFEPGETVNHFQIPPLQAVPDPQSPTPISLRIGVTICEDLWNDEEFWGKRTYEINPIADLAQVGVNLTVNLSASPFAVGKQSLREAILKHTATRFNQPVIYVNQVGGNDDLIFDGHSVAVNRRGEVVCRAQGFEADLVFVEYDEDQQDLVALPQAIVPLPANEDEEIWRALVLGVRDYARKCGFSKAVIGLSGGIDSALVAAIAAAALGRENVLGVLMPSPYSSDHSIQDALQLAQNLGISTQTLPIGELMQGFDRALQPLFAETKFGLAEENIQSRIRGTLLMGISNKFGYLLLSTGNKSEMAVGYCTLYGDMNGGLAVIADVPKTRVYSICEWLNQSTPSSLHPFTPNPVRLNAHVEAQPQLSNPHPPTPNPPVIPANILTKAPSAELKPGQVDQDSLPPYEILDDILARLIHNHQTPDQIVAAGHQADVVNQVIRLVARAEFKRRQAPPVLKVTDRAFGVGWRMPIANRWQPKAAQVQPNTESQPLQTGNA